MSMLKNNFFANRILSVDSCILLLRIFTVCLLFYKHGYEKIFGFREMLGNFPDPIGIGKLPGLTFALITDSICTVLIAIGLFTRISALLILINLSVAFIGVHNGTINDHGEAMILYIINMLFLFLAGPGKYSLDAKNHFKI